MYLRLDHHSGEPIYRQIMEAVKYKVASGQLSPEEQLVSIRGLAEELKINPRTVLKAYEELEREGVVVMRQGQGVFVGSNHGIVPAGIRKHTVTALTRRLLAEAMRMGTTPAEVIEIVREEARKMSPTHSPTTPPSLPPRESEKP